VNHFETKFPLALREDHNPPFLFLLPPALRLFLVFVRWTSYRCPFCHAVFRRDFWPYNVRLGDGQRPCNSCGRLFDDGAREWPELALAKKLRFYFPPLVLALAASSLFCGIFMLCIAPLDVLSWTMGIVVIGACLSPLALWSLVRLVWVSRSSRRYAEKEVLAGRRAVQPN